ncbi:MAG: tRNA (adenosine(37)-N6)-threonylcarbamoyltransferase complex ATPase subunit type 1 TsaE [Candidatus Marinimicrobia bacterium]|nr:tRNA (adenosine(37)-N6)-threonylcarbamoyltransferase complex ATPase subunit type 1 TsaE [Candidatus Neomarinimicrobiota bacterium]
MKQGWAGGITSSAEETIQLGKSLSEYIEAGDILTLDGDLAAGKTTFVKGILSGLNFENEVTSPTFTLINEYEAKHRVIHMDCYRENNLQRWINLGIQDYFYSDDIKIIEWPEIISILIPENHISITLTSISEFKRKIYIK